ncbi:MAG: hypothetical protein OXN89_26675 [Bryobacterales bacterium]|nr:hypothetical protein [Bryobacterales bacterium]
MNRSVNAPPLGPLEPALFRTVPQRTAKALVVKLLGARFALVAVESRQATPDEGRADSPLPIKRAAQRHGSTVPSKAWQHFTIDWRATRIR